MLQLRLWLLSLALLQLLAEAALSTACLRIFNSKLGMDGHGIPCGVVTPNSGFTTCCNPGSTCLQDNICQSPGVPGGGFTTYYLGGCSDPTYLDPSCSPYCRDVARQDIVYNATTSTWACCGTESDGDTVNCDVPTDEKFNAPAPSALSATFTIGTAAITGPATSFSISSSSSSSSISSLSSPSQSRPVSSPTSSASSTRASDSTNQPSPTTVQTNPSQPAASRGLSIGAKVGIGISAAIGAVALLVGVLLYLKRRKARLGAGDSEKVPEYAPVQTYEVQEMEASSNRGEMDAHMAHEM